MKTLNHILSSASTVKVIGNAQQEVTSLCIDSRECGPGACFIAIKGHSIDGHNYIDDAVASGAVVIVAELLPPIIHTHVTYVQVNNSSEMAGLIAASFYDHPSAHMKVVGVTGTNGKTTVATLLYQLFERLGYPCGLISTVQNQIHKEVVRATHTTPDALAVQRLLKDMYEAGCVFVFMEVSSHAIHQHRIAGIEFDGGIFTNITHDHLDYHETFDEYLRVKKAFFDHLPKAAFALTNMDDKRGRVMLQNCKAHKCSYALRNDADYKAKVLDNQLSGLHLVINGKEAHFRISGTFNAYNLLAVYGSAIELGAESEEVLPILTALEGAAGRMETFISPVEHLVGIIDYAHTPDALLNVLTTIKQMRHQGQQIISVVGCGGDRDKAKRPLMAQVAAEHSNRCVFTADNPRSEDPQKILDEMEAGLSLTHQRKVLRIADRKEAIKTACTLAQKGDVVLIAGKGHETYQEINGVRYDFDDRKILSETFQLLNK